MGGRDAEAIRIFMAEVRHCREFAFRADQFRADRESPLEVVEVKIGDRDERRDFRHLAESAMEVGQGCEVLRSFYAYADMPCDRLDQGPGGIAKVGERIYEPGGVVAREVRKSDPRPRRATRVSEIAGEGCGRVSEDLCIARDCCQLVRILKQGRGKLHGFESVGEVGEIRASA
jgi:hypothetical protein